MRRTKHCLRKWPEPLLKLLDKDWQSYFAATEAYREDPSKFKKPPKLPHYKPKQHGRNILVYTSQALSRAGLKQGLIQPSRLPITIETRQTRIAQVRIVPRAGCYVVEVVYERAETASSGNPALVAAVDLGVNNLAAITANKQGFAPRLVNGRVLKSWNQFYNKRGAELQAALGHPGSTKRLERLTLRQTRRIKAYLHEAARR